MRGAIALAVVAIATGCYPPSQTPTTQEIPPGGRVVATGPILTQMWIQDASDDLSSILYAREPFDVNVEAQLHYRYWVYDDDARTTVEVPVGNGEFGDAALSPDERFVVFSSNDPAMQVGPVSVNCVHTHGPFRPDTYHMCGELYLWDRVTGQTRQLTGLSGSSPYAHFSPKFTPDGTAVDVIALGGIARPGLELLRVDVATGQVSPTPPSPPCCTWVRGTRQIRWDDNTGVLTSTDTTTGVVLTLWQDVAPFVFLRSIDDGRYIVVSRWVDDQHQVFRLIDTATGAAREVPSQWVSRDVSRSAFVQSNVAPEAIDRLIIAPLG